MGAGFMETFGQDGGIADPFGGPSFIVIGLCPRPDKALMLETPAIILLMVPIVFIKFQLPTQRKI